VEAPSVLQYDIYNMTLTILGSEKPMKADLKKKTNPDKIVFS